MYISYNPGRILLKKMDKSLLERFFKGECSLEEQKMVINWYLSGKADEELAKEITTYWKKEDKTIDDQWNSEELFETIDQQITHSQKSRVIKFKQRRSSGKNSPHWYYAAAAVLLFLLGGLWYFDIQSSNPTHLPHKKYISEQALKGEKRTVSLPDGTLARLNANSRIWYSEDFNRDTFREIYLEGEAFLEVSKDPSRPFKVHTANIVTTVLGTSFNVNAFDPDNSVSISLVSGEVKVERHDSQTSSALPIHLLPGEQVVYSREDPSPIKRDFDPAQTLSWKDGVLYFKNAKFTDVVNTLKNWYGIEIEVRREGIEDGFSGVYDNTPLETVLEGMSFVLGFDYEINNKTIIIK